MRRLSDFTARALGRLALGRLALGRLALALGIGTVGGALFTQLGVPLAWLIGAMCLTTASALAGAKIMVPAPLRWLMIAVLGTMVGSAFRPEMFERAGQWLVSLSGLLVYVAVVAVVISFYFRRVARYDRSTAYFSAIPGGLAEMIVVGGAMGGDDRTIALTHASRILLVVLTIPIWFRWVEGYQPTPGDVGEAIASIPAFDLVVLALCAVVGFVGARALRLPGATLIGPLALSAAAHLTGLTESRPPSEIVVVSQVVIGASVGCRFAGVKAKRVLSALLVAAGSTILMLGISVASAVVLHAVAGLPVEALVLAYAPGGVAEMSLIALALGIDPAFVSTHHVVRIVLVVVLAPAAFKLFVHFQERRARAAEQEAKGD